MAERDGKGRFLKGNKGSPGRKRRFIEERHLKAQSKNLDLLRKTVTPKMLERIVQAAVLAAIQERDAAAHEWLSRYILPPVETINATAMQAIQVNIQQGGGTHVVFVAPQQVAEGGWDALVEGVRSFPRAEAEKHNI